VSDTPDGRLPGGSGRVTMREVAAVRQVKTQDFVAGLQAGEEYRGIGLCAGVWLHIGPGSAKQFLEAVDGELFHFVHHFTSTIIAATGITFGVFIGQAGTHGIDYGLARKVFGSNEFHTAALAVEFFPDEVKNNIRHDD